MVLSWYKGFCTDDFSQRKRRFGEKPEVWSIKIKNQAFREGVNFQSDQQAISAASQQQHY